jgi:hypothetical protein
MVAWKVAQQEDVAEVLLCDEGYERHKKDRLPTPVVVFFSIERVRNA